jgi:hypothetical protein
MSEDIKIFNACDHIVDGQNYVIQLCPRCYGKGYYLDCCFETDGSLITTSGSIKLQQEMLKIIIDEKYTNIFHEDWGSEIHNMIGHKSINITKAKLEILIREALNHLKSVQMNEYYNVGNVTIDEILDQILYIEIRQLVPTGYWVEVTISNNVGEIYTQSVTF